MSETDKGLRLTEMQRDALLRLWYGRPLAPSRTAKTPESLLRRGLITSSINDGLQLTDVGRAEVRRLMALREERGE